ncbi:MAG: helix-turn-helix domain-containing protein [Homoserinimonas sp.]|nr:helix-turn-helix domain-containing protein [Homoserinimonas sp.]MCW5944436.1 helix-turn-helix domain-containing protein [Cryobacterium sp.]
MSTVDSNDSLGRFLTIADTAELLNVSLSQTYSLVRSGELPAIRIGNKGQWRIEREVLESFILAKYEESRRAALWNQSDFANVSDFHTLELQSRR